MSESNRTPYGQVGSLYKRLHCIWVCMKQRCDNPRHTHWRYYGGRGICVCEEWRSFTRFRMWAISSGYDDSLSIDRINSDGNYEPTNCRWISRAENTSLANQCKKIKGTGGCTLNMEKASEVKQMILRGGYTETEIAEMFGVSSAIIGNIRRGRTWLDAEPAGPVGPQRKKAQLKPEQVLEIKALLRTGAFNYSEIGEMFNVPQRIIQLIKRGTSWGSVGQPGPITRKIPRRRRRKKGISAE